MVKSLSASLIFINSRGVVFQRCRKSNLAWDWASIDNLIHHCNLSSFCLSDDSMFFYCVNFSRPLSCTSTSRAILTLDFSTATKPIIMAFSLIRRTSLVSDIVFFDPLIGQWRVATMTAPISHIAREKYLGSQKNIWPSGISHNFNSIAEWARHCERPTRATVSGYMLVSLKS